MSAAIVPSGTGFGVTLMPANPVSPLRTVKVERYVPGGGSSLVGVAGEEHALLNPVKSMSEMAKRIGPHTSCAVAHTGGWSIWVSKVSPGLSL
jgi:hypothetical protein